MNTYMLIIALSIAGGSASSGTGIHSQQIPGYTSEQKCRAAGEQAVRELSLDRDGDPRYHHGDVRVTFSCLPQ